MKSDSVSRCQVSQEVEFANTSNCLGPPSTQAVRTAEIDRLDRQITYEGGLLAPLTPSAQPLRGSHRTGKPFERRVDRHPSAWDLSAHGPDSMRRTSTVADPFQLQARLPRTRSPPTLAMLCSGRGACITPAGTQYARLVQPGSECFSLACAAWSRSGQAGSQADEYHPGVGGLVSSAKMLPGMGGGYPELGLFVIQYSTQASQIHKQA